MFRLLGICKCMVYGLCQVWLGFYGKDLLGVPIMIGLWRGAKQGWALSFLGESGLTFRHLDLDMLTFRLRLVRSLLVTDHLDEDSLIWPSPRVCVVFGYAKLIGYMVTFSYFERRVTLMFSFEFFFIKPQNFRMQYLLKKFTFHK